MQKAGFRPPAATSLPLTPAPAETRPPLGPRGTDALHQMVVNSLFLDLLPGYLTRVGEAGRRVPAALLVPLLQHATRSPATTAALGPVLGSRGRWLAALHPAWAKLLANTAAETTTPDPATWETGTLPERLAWLRQHFTQDADAARALLLAALPTEPAKAQEALLEILANHLHPAAEPTLETLLKARGQEVRRTATELLVQLPGAALTERLWARAAPLITARRKLLGLGKPALEVTLPAAWDKTWLADGLEEKPGRHQYAGASAAQGPATARLGQLLALLPPRRWAAHLDLEPLELLAAALASEWALPLLPAWAHATLLHQDVDFATAFLNLRKQHRLTLQKSRADQALDWAALAELLPPAARQALLLPALLLRVRQQAPDWTTDLDSLPAPWPAALSAAVIDAIATPLANTTELAPYGGPAGQLRTLAWLLPQTVAPNLAPADMAAAIERVESIVQPHDIFQAQLHTFVATLRFRAELEASLNE
jgi:hypothetical protein